MHLTVVDKDLPNKWAEANTGSVTSHTASNIVPLRRWKKRLLVNGRCQLQSGPFIGIKTAGEVDMDRHTHHHQEGLHSQNAIHLNREWDVFSPINPRSPNYLFTWTSARENLSSNRISLHFDMYVISATLVAMLSRHMGWYATTWNAAGGCLYLSVKMAANAEAFYPYLQPSSLSQTTTSTPGYIAESACPIQACLGYCVT
jgi:hypothetical protein